MNRAITLELQGHHDLAKQAYRKAEQLFWAQQDAFGLAHVRHNLSVFLTNVGQLSEAQSYLSRALDAYEEAADKQPYRLTTIPADSSRWQRARLMLEDAAQYLEHADPQTAIEVLCKAEILAFGASERMTSMRAQFLQREVALLDEHVRSFIADGEHNAAILLLERLESLHEALGDLHQHVMALSARGLVLMNAGDLASARVALERARSLAEELGFDDIQQDVGLAFADPRWNV